MISSLFSGVCHFDRNKAPSVLNHNEFQIVNHFSNFFLSDSNNPQILHKLGKLDVPIGKGLAGITIDKYNNFLLTVKRPYDNRPHQSITVFREDCWVRCDNLILENLMNPEIEFYDGKNFYFDKMFSKMKPINVWFNQMNGKLFVCDVNKHRSRVLIFQGVSVRKEKYKKKQNLGGK